MIRNMRSIFSCLFLIYCVLNNQCAWAQTDQVARQTAEAALSPEEKHNLSIKIFRGDFNGDGKNDAITFAFFGFEGGNGSGLIVFLMENIGNSFRIVSKPDVAGDNPRNVKFSKGLVTFGMTVEKPNDPRCCPTGFKTFRIPVRTISISGEEKPTAVFDPLQGKICRNEDEYISLKDKILTLDSGGDSMTFRDVRLKGCSGLECTYTGRQSARWQVKTVGSGIDVSGTVFAGGGSSPFAKANFRFPQCKKL